MEKVKVFAPASVSNVGPGYDVLGFSIEGIGDIVELVKVDRPGVKITKITGAELSYSPDSNVVGVVIQRMMNDFDTDFGVEVSLEKQVKPGSGLGSSASSSAGAVMAMNQLLGQPLDLLEMTRYAMLGEEFISQKAHADNVAPCLFGGLTIVRSYQPFDIIQVPVSYPPFLSIVHPQIEIRTADAKKLIADEIKLDVAIEQMGNIASLVTGLTRGNKSIIRRSMQDHIAVPFRSKLIPHFEDAERIAYDLGSFGFSISGSGPTMFAFCETAEIAESINGAIAAVYGTTETEVKTYVSRMSSKGVELL